MEDELLTSLSDEANRIIFEELSGLYNKRLNTLGRSWSDDIIWFINDLRDYVVNQAQEAHRNALRKIIEWGEEDCPHKKPGWHTPRWQSECETCWQELEKEVERGR